MAPHGSSSPGALALGNRTSRLSKDVRQSSRVAPPQPFVTDQANTFFPEEATLDPQLQGPNVSESYGYYEYPRSNLTFGTGFGAEPNDGHIEIPGDDGTSYTVPASDTANLELDAMSRFEQGPDPVPFIGPKSVEGMRGWKTTSQIIPRPQGAYDGYRNGPPSDMGTSYSHVRNDSGYISRSYHESEQLSQHDEDTRSMIQKVEHACVMAEGVSLSFSAGIHVPLSNPDKIADAEVTPPPNTRNWAAQSSNGQRQCQHPDCSETKSMNPSEYKKHMQRHDKPFRCSVPECKRFIDGFATQNDLARHTKSVHHELSASANERSFICKGNRCTHRSKIWPRLDNFKAHCRRRHKSEDLESLVRKSAYDVRTREFIADLPKGFSGIGANDVQTTIEQMGGNGATRAIQPDTSMSIDLFQPGPNNKLMGTDMSATTNHAQTVYKLSAGSFSDAQLPASQRNEARMDDNSTTDQCDPLAGLEVASLEQENFQSWPGGLDELEQGLVSDFAAAQGQGHQPTPNELGAIAKARIREFFKKPRKRMASEAGLDTSDETKSKQGPLAEKNASSQPRTVKCSTCSKEMSRLCDLKKHQKRHSRPWGCTDEKCSKTFGSKNDWKRHENSQHYQLETWRCHEPCDSSLIGVCAKIFYRQDPFRAHLRKDHGIGTDSYIRDQCRQRRIGRNWQDRFWCGFCKDIVKLQQKGLQAWDERFNHIDDRHFKHGQSIEDWYPLDKDVPKGQLRRERNARMREIKTGNGLPQLPEDDEVLSNVTDEELPPMGEGRGSPPPPLQPQQSILRDLSVWSSPSHSFDEEKAMLATAPVTKSSMKSQPTMAGGEANRTEGLSHEKNVPLDSRQTSIESDTDERDQNLRICRGCASILNPEIDPSCPECGMRVAHKSTDYGATRT